MSNIYGVILKNEGKIYYFNGNDLEIEKDTKVVVDTEKGFQLGKVVSSVDDKKINISVDDMKKNS